MGRVFVDAQHMEVDQSGLVSWHESVRDGSWICMGEISLGQDVGIERSCVLALLPVSVWRDRFVMKKKRGGEGEGGYVNLFAWSKGEADAATKSGNKHLDLYPVRVSCGARERQRLGINRFLAGGEG
jgi:hypothetical protein